MNIANTEVPLNLVAKISGCNKMNRKITYFAIDSYHSLCLDKKDIISAQLHACERLLEYVVDAADKETIEKEIAELKIAFGVML